MNFDKLRADLERDEGRRKRIYVDTVGKVSVGVGRNLTDRGLRDDEIDLMLTNDIAEVVGELDHALPWWRDLDEPRQRALANMVFNLGMPRLLGFPLMIAALRIGAWDEAAKQARNSRWYRQVGDRGERIATVIQYGGPTGD